MPDFPRYRDTQVVQLYAPTGDASGAADTQMIADALTRASPGGRVVGKPGSVYQTAPVISKTVLNPSGGTSSQQTCNVLPPGVTLDMQGSTVQLRGSTPASLFINSNADNAGARDTDIGLVNVILDGRNVAATTTVLAQLSYLDRLTMDRVKVINGVNGGVSVIDCTNSRFDHLAADGVQGDPYYLGDPQGTGTGHNQIYDSTFGSLYGQNITLLNTGSQPGNLADMVLTRCTIDSIRSYTTHAGIKIQQPSEDVAIGEVIVHTCGQATALNSGFKIQGDPSYAAGTDRIKRVRVGRVISQNCANVGLFMHHSEDCAVMDYVGRDNVLLHNANCDVVISGGIRPFVGNILSVNSHGGGVNVTVLAATPAAKNFRLPNVKVINPGQASTPGPSLIKSALRIDVTGATGTIGDLVTIDDQGSPTMTYGVEVIPAGITGFVSTFTESGHVTAAKTNASSGTFIVP